MENLGTILESRIKNLGTNPKSNPSNGISHLQNILGKKGFKKRVGTLLLLCMFSKI